MDARARKVGDILHSGDQYLIPFFQRSYSWERKHWKRLLDDLAGLIEAPSDRLHFLGPLVCAPADHVPGEVTAYQLIDGQQRLTTLSLALCALRGLAAEAGDGELDEEITDSFLVHRWKKGLQRYKVVPRLGDREALLAIVDGEGIEEFGDLGLVRCFNYVKKRLKSMAKSDPEKVLPLLLSAITSRMSLVVITITGENPYEIFESLNSTGLPLEQADLIRNYLFMQVPMDGQEDFDEQHWRPFEEFLEKTNERPAIHATGFYRDYLMRTGEYSKKTDTYIDFKGQNRERAIAPPEQVAELKRFAFYAESLRRPPEKLDPRVRKLLRELSKLEVSTANPLLLALMDRHDSGELTADALAQILEDLASFVLRRSIAGESTRPYSRWFPAAVRSIEADPVDDLREYWVSKGWPSDTRFRAALLEFSLYKREPKKCRLILERLEESYGHKEKVDPEALTIEHILPQSVGDDKAGQHWKESLGEAWFEAHQQWVHTLGNLTLTGYNPDMSNSEFPKKRPALVDSNLVLNTYFREVESWSPLRIEERGQQLAEEVARLWQAPLLSVPTQEATPAKKVRQNFDVEALRQSCLSRLAKELGAEATAQGGDGTARYLLTDGSHLLCVASQPYPGVDGHTGYWFGVSPDQVAFLEEADSRVALCCGSPDRILLLPLAEFVPLLQQMNETDGRHWHVQVDWGSAVLVDQPKEASKNDIGEYLLGSGVTGE